MTTSTENFLRYMLHSPDYRNKVRLLAAKELRDSRSTLTLKRQS